MTPHNLGENELDLSNDFVLFSKILSKAVHENKDLRKFIRSEALKKIDMDYDVFYSFIKNNIVSDNLTFREILISYSDDKASFQDLESRNPNTSFRSTPTNNIQTSFKWIYLPDQHLEPLLTAYHEMGVDITKWQRDNIYYGLTDQIQEGPLRRNFAERIYFLRFSIDAYNTFTDQNDPKPNPSAPTPSQLWTDGQFEFRIDILVNNISGAGTNIYKHFRARPDELFKASYASGTSNGKTYYYITSIQTKSYDPNHDNFNLNLVTWDLKNNGSTWKFIISEIDDQETYTTEDSNTVTYAQNFEFSQQWGEDVKKGLKYGNTTTISGVNRYNIVTYKNSDDLGTLEVNFSDPIILHATDDRYDGVSLYSVSNSYVEMALVPVRLY